MPPFAKQILSPAEFGSERPKPRVPFVDLGRQHSELSEELRRAFVRTLETGSFVLGQEVECFEDEFAAFCGVRQCIGVASGTSALTIALLAAGIRPGDEVIVPAHTFIASALAVLHAGATPVFCDVRQSTGLIDPRAAETAITSRTTALLAVDLYGQVCEMESLERLSYRHGLLLIEDAAQAHGAWRGRRRAGSFGLASAFSFYPSKNLGALGDGGAICTDDEAIADGARQLRNLGRRHNGESLVAGYTERLDGVQAAMLRIKLPHLDRWNECRRSHAQAYFATLGSEFGALDVDLSGSPVYHLFPVRIRNRTHLAAALGAAGIETRVHYAKICPEHPALAQFSGSDLPVAESWAREELSLPMFAELAQSELEYVVERCNREIARCSGACLH
jgi:dTDP-4-amino-4,6-dideoxygalactose transaminase